jgi:hypothetical protein
MKKIYLFATILVIVSCNTYKQANKNILKGNYEVAFYDMVKKYQSGIKDKNKSTHIGLLQDAYSKANERDFKIINDYSAIKDPVKHENIYYALDRINNRQETLKPLLPIQNDGGEVYFKIENISKDLFTAKDNYTDYLFDTANSKLKLKNKLQAREAYNLFKKVKYFSPNYTKINERIDEAEFLGTNYVLMTIENLSATIIPINLEADLKQISSYGLNKDWTVFETEKRRNFNYDFVATLFLQNIAVSPERITNNNFYKEKQVKDGQIEAKDKNGNVLKDGNGNTIFVDKFITISCEIKELHQFKEAFITAKMQIKDVSNNKMLNENISSHFVFDDLSAMIRGDERALDEEYFTRVKREPLYLPSNEQMVFDCGQDLKMRMKGILNNYFRN